MNTPPPAEGAAELGERWRAVGAIFWSGFLAAALATVLCFAFIDPVAITDGMAEGDAPSWWTSRRAVYAVGFFFFWLIGLTAAALCWQLARPGRRGG